MPEVDGFELAEIIREHPRYQKTAIIFVSAVHLTDLDRVKGYESGAVDYVSVPVVPELLRAKVRVFAELYRKSRELERLNRELEQRVAERTAELETCDDATQMELTQQLRQADRRKDEFLALAGPRAAQSARRRAERDQHPAVQGAARSRADLVSRRDRTPGEAAHPAGGRSARRFPDYPGQDQAAGRAASISTPDRGGAVETSRPLDRRPAAPAQHRRFPARADPWSRPTRHASPRSFPTC